MLKPILASLAVLTPLMLPLNAWAGSLYSDVYIFGDSLSDTGNAFRDTGVPPSPYYMGRTSNGPLWVDYFVPELGLTLDPSKNFAYVGATTSAVNTTFSNNTGLSTQINNFISRPGSADPNALYMIWAGANDYLNQGITDVNIPVNNLITAVNNLATEGARNIVVFNLPSLGSLPNTNTMPSVSTPLNILTQSHNTLLQTQLSQMTNSNLNLTFLDVNSLFANILDQPQNFQFTNVTDACLNISAQTLCSDSNSYFFWDGVHPSTRGHQEVARLALGVLTVPESEPILGLFAVAFVGIVARFHKQ